jgi:hypothetical protein
MSRQKYMTPKVRAQCIASSRQSNPERIPIEVPRRETPHKCECCGRVAPLCLDHIHRGSNAGRFRGWICRWCNYGHGTKLDDPAWVQQWLIYITRPLQSDPIGWVYPRTKAEGHAAMRGQPSKNALSRGHSMTPDAIRKRVWRGTLSINDLEQERERLRQYNIRPTLDATPFSI